MQNNLAARWRRQRVAKENAADRANRTDAQQIRRLRKAGHTAEREITRLKTRIKKEGEKCS